FTNLSEKADPAALVAQLNRYLSSMVPMVFDNGGTLDKFIGDAIMAVWGNVRSHCAAEDAKAAVRAALGMRRGLAKLNAGWRAEGRCRSGIFEVARHLRRGDRQIPETRFQRREDSVFTFPRILSGRFSREDVSRERARIRTSTAGRSLERGRSFQKEVGR